LVFSSGMAAAAALLQTLDNEASSKGKWASHLCVEHGRAPESRVAAWQDRLTPLWKRIGGGCHLNRKVDALLTEAGFTIDELRTAYLPGPRPMTYTYQGFAYV